MSSTVLASCLLLLSRYCSFFPSFPFLFSSFAFLYMVTFNWNTCTKIPLFLAFLLTLIICLGRSMLMAIMALLRNVLCPATQMSWAILFQTAHKRWVLFHFFLLCFFFSCIFQLLILTCFPSNFSPLFRSMGCWFGWLGISSWRWLNIQRTCMAPDD